MSSTTSGASPSDASSTSTTRGLIDVGARKGEHLLLARRSGSPRPAVAARRAPGTSRPHAPTRRFSVPRRAYMITFSRTVSDGKMPRPSGMWQMPRDARWNGLSCEMSSPSSTTRRSRTQQSGCHAQRGRLARAVGPEQRDHRRVGNDQRHVAQHRRVAVPADDVAELEHQMLPAGSVPIALSTSSEPRYAACTSSLARTSSGRAVEQRATEVEHVDVLADLHHQRHVVLDQQQTRPAFGHDPLQHRAEALGLGRVETRRRFVEQDDVEVAGQAARRARRVAVHLT